MRIAVSQLNPIVGALQRNRERIEAALDQARSAGAQLVVFSELALCGYPPEDLLLLPDFIEAARHELEMLLPATKGLVAVIGTVRPSPYGPGKPLCDSAAICENGRLIGFQDKTLLPTYDVFDEARYFQPATETRVWPLLGHRVAITVCEDIWCSEYGYARDPLNDLISQRPTLLINLSASPYSVERELTRFKVCSQAAKRLGCCAVLVNQVGANDSLIFDGHSMLCGPDGLLRAHAQGFKEDFCVWDIEPLPAPVQFKLDLVDGLRQALVLGIRDYFHKQGFKRAILGLSGGIDSAVVAALAAEALGPENVTGVSLPSRFTSPESLEDARATAEGLAIHFREIPIEHSFVAALETLAPVFGDLAWDVTEENLQARIRGMLLMAMSNKEGSLLLNTGNKSEMAMGYFTLYGDGCGALAVLSDVTKEQVYNLARRMSALPQRVVEKAPSAELRAGQRDSDTLPPYPILDPVLSNYIERHLPIREIEQRCRASPELVERIVRGIHRAEYKRRQTPIGLRVTPKAFSKGRMFPIVQGYVT